MAMTDIHSCGYHCDRLECIKAQRDYLREKLAQPEQSVAGYCKKIEELIAERDSLRAALAQPEQEPVAKVELMLTGGNAGLATRIVEIYDHLRERLRPGQLLYTHPPQRKPDYKEFRDWT